MYYPIDLFNFDISAIIVSYGQNNIVSKYEQYIHAHSVQVT